MILRLQVPLKVADRQTDRLTKRMTDKQMDRCYWCNLVTAILKLLVTGRRDGDYKLVRTVCVHRIT